MRLACNHPCSLTSPRKLTKLPPQTAWWWTAKPTGWKAHTRLPSWQGEGPCIQSTIVFGIFYVFDMSEMSNSTLYAVLHKSRKHHLRHPQHCFDLLYLSISTPPRSNNVCWHMPFNVHTRDKVKMGMNEWLPHYLIWSRSHCNSNFNSKWVVVWRNNPK